MTTLADSVQAFLASRGWPIDVDDNLIRSVVRTDDQAFPLAVVVVESVGQLVVYSIYPNDVPADRRAAVAELATRTNVVLTVGNLEIELDGGQVRFRTGLGVGASPVSEEMIERVVLDNAASALAYFPLVALVASGEVEPDVALASLGGD